MAKKTNLEKFEEFHAANPHVYGLFKKFSAQAIRAGIVRSSAHLIVERIRWEESIKTTGAGFDPLTRKPFKISNMFIAYYARKFMEEYPKVGAFFDTRDLKVP